jgi:hypothetical protein
MQTPIQASKEIKRIITFETNSIGEPMPVVIYKKKAVSSTTASPTASIETVSTTAKTVFDKVVESQIQAASEFKTLNEQAGVDWLNQLGKNIALSLVKGGTAFDSSQSSSSQSSSESSSQ